MKRESERNRRKCHKKSEKSGKPEKSNRRDKLAKSADESKGKISRRKYERSSSPRENKHDSAKISDKSRSVEYSYTVYIRQIR